MRAAGLLVVVALTACGGVSSSGDQEDAAPDNQVDAGEIDATPEPDACFAGVTVNYSGSVLPADIDGFYDEAFDCQRSEGGADFGGVDSSHCFRKSDGSAWRVWNTGCGWEIGLVEGGGWNRHARYYTGLCADIPPQGLTTEALTTATFFDGFGDPIADLVSSFEDCM